MKIPTPQEIGLPEKFEKWRPTQEAALTFLANGRPDNSKGKRVRAACVPTGGGKSPLVVAEAILSGLPTAIVTQDLGLMKQYMDDFESIGMVSLKGRDRYQCGLRDDFTCGDGYAARCPYKGTTSCPSTKAELKARLSNLVVTNYAKWTASKKFGQGMDHFKQVIFDESDIVPEQLASAMRIELNHKELEETLGIDFPVNLRDTKEWDPDLNAFNMRIWKGWARDAKITVEQEMIDTYNKIKQSHEPKQAWVRHFSHMKNLVRRLAIIVTATVENWVVDDREQGYVFDPIAPARYAEAVMLLRVPSIIFVSATNRPKTLHLSGISRGSYSRQMVDGSIETENYVFQEYDSDFNPADCPIYYIPTQRVDNKHPDRSMLWHRLDQWLSPRQDRKSTVHTISYARKEEILSVSRFAHKMIFNERGEPTAKLVEDFKAAGPGSILISPNIGRGYDLADDLCESQFLCKIPFEPPSKIVKAREHYDKEYRGYKAMQYIVQAAGRGNRHKGDRCDFAIPDDNMTWFLPQHSHLAPRSFHKRFKMVDVVPRPLVKM